MKKTINLLCATALMAIAGTASAATQSETSFLTASSSAFSNSFLITPTTDNSLFIMVSGAAAQFSALQFAINDGPSVVAKLLGGSLWVASFNDGANTTYANQFSLAANVPYQLTVSGTTSALPYSETNGSVTLLTRSASLSSVHVSYPDVTAPVPEPETYAMLLAGLGLIGAVTRKRRAR